MHFKGVLLFYGFNKSVKELIKPLKNISNM